MVLGILKVVEFLGSSKCCETFSGLSIRCFKVIMFLIFFFFKIRVIGLNILFYLSRLILFFVNGFGLFFRGFYVLVYEIDVIFIIFRCISY